MPGDLGSIQEPNCALLLTRSSLRALVSMSFYLLPSLVLAISENIIVAFTGCLKFTFTTNFGFFTVLSKCHDLNFVLGYKRLAWHLFSRLFCSTTDSLGIYHLYKNRRNSIPYTKFFSFNGQYSGYGIVTLKCRYWFYYFGLKRRQGPRITKRRKNFRVPGKGGFSAQHR